jgi:hypothetical protein
MPPNRYNNIINGTPLSRPVASAIVEQFGDVSSDFLLYGKRGRGDAKFEEKLLAWQHRNGKKIFSDAAPTTKPQTGAPRYRGHRSGFAHACKMGLEGIVSKRLGSRYRSGRSPDWLKFKNPAAPAVKREAEEDWGR